MARDASRARNVEVVVEVAIGALARRHRMAPHQGESGTVVVERRVQPSRRVVALIAGLGEVARDVVRIGGAIVVLQVAGHAGRAIQSVVVVGVAIRTLPRRNGVHAG